MCWRCEITKLAFPLHRHERMMIKFGLQLTNSGIQEALRDETLFICGVKHKLQPWQKYLLEKEAKDRRLPFPENFNNYPFESWDMQPDVRVRTFRDSIVHWDAVDLFRLMATPNTAAWRKDIVNTELDRRERYAQGYGTELYIDF